MTTITSPRSPQLKSPTSSTTPSTRSSLSIDRPNPRIQTGTGNSRRNRSALRDYYNLSTATPSTNVVPATPQTNHTAVPDTSSAVYDSPDFNATEYVSSLLRDDGLAKIMRTEAELLSDIRGLDGEKKALVYDNYSKLIDATETIGRVREMLEVEALTGEKKKEMDVVKKIMEPEEKGEVDGKGKLDELVGRVIEIASQGHVNVAEADSSQKQRSDSGSKGDKHNQQKATVRWVLGTPRRIEQALNDGDRDRAEKNWNEVKPLLDKWKGVKGTQDLVTKCESLLAPG